MTPVERAAERGHVMERFPTVNGFEQFVCRRCGAKLLVDGSNPSGFGSSLERGCLGSDAA